MSLYQKIKSAITVRQVGEMYGMEPDRHGMVCCPFHSDSDPSMKLNDNYYYCFGCGANGDAIDLTAKLFDLNPRQAAEKLITDFGLDPDKPPANAIALPPPKRGLTDEQWADIAYCLRVLTDYLDLLHDWRERYKPATPEEPHDPRFEEALHMTETIEHLTDCVACPADGYHPLQRQELCGGDQQGAGQLYPGSVQNAHRTEPLSGRLYGDRRREQTTEKEK